MTGGEGPNGGSKKSFAAEDALHMRRLSHDMNNALEIIVQASYLVNTTPLSDMAKDWMKLLDQGVRQLADHNKELREYILKRS
jgi:hypothetical protein